MDGLLEKGRFWLWSLLTLLGLLSTMLLSILAFEAATFTRKFDELVTSVNNVNLQLTTINNDQANIKEKQKILDEIDESHDARLRSLELWRARVER